MTRTQFIASLVLTSFAVTMPVVASAADKTRVTSVEIKRGKLAVTAGGKSCSLDGKYVTSRGQWVEFDDGEAVAVLGKNNRKESIQKTRIDSGKVVFVTVSGEVVLGSGKYEQGVTQPPEPPEPEPQPTPNAFEVEDGKIASVWIGGSI